MNKDMDKFHTTTVAEASASAWARRGSCSRKCLTPQVKLAALSAYKLGDSPPLHHSKVLHFHWLYDPRPTRLRSRFKLREAELVSHSHMAELLYSQSAKNARQKVEDFKYKISQNGLNHGEANMKRYPANVLRVAVVLVATRADGAPGVTYRFTWMPVTQSEVAARMKPYEEFWLDWFKGAFSRRHPCGLAC